MEVLLVQHSDDAVEVVVIHRQPGIAGRSEFLRDLFLRALDADGLDIHTRRHDFLGVEVVELYRVLDQFALLRLDASFGFHLFYHGKQLVLGHRAAAFHLEYLRQQFLPQREDHIERRKYHYEHSNDRS